MARTIIIPNDVFFTQLVELMDEGKTVTFVVKGYSMYPFMRNEKDSVTMVRYDGQGLKRGDVILFRFFGRYILHRIAAVRRDVDGSRVYVTRGDGNVQGVEEATDATVCGVMLSRVTPAGRSWACSSFSWRLASWLWQVLSPFRRYILFILRRIYK